MSLTNGSALKGYDYDPWGNLLGGATAPRRGFNDNEKDKENGLFSLGVRKYEEGRFLSLDPLFEKEPEISPYVYAGNAPLNYVDPEGLQRNNTSDPSRTIRLQLPNGRLFRGLPENFAPPIPKYSYEHVGANQRAMEIRSQAARTGANAQPLPNAAPRATIAASSGTAASTATTVANSAGSAMAKPAIPTKALQVIEYANLNNGAAQSGYKGSRSFANDGRQGGQVLPRTDANGNAISYKEYDVNAYKKGVNRGEERVVIGSDGKSYYTNDHYQTFTEVQK